MSQSLVVANLFARPMRTLATVLAIALEVVLILLVAGLTRGMVNESAKRLEGIGADIVLQPPGSSFMLASSTAAMSEKLTELLAGVPGVRAVSPVMVQLNTQGGIGLIYGIDSESFDRVTRRFTFLQGRAFQNSYEVIVDDIHAKSKKLQVGQEVKFLNHNFRVSGIFEHGKGSRVFLPLRTIQDLTGTPGKVSLMFIKCESREEIAAVAARLREKLKGYTVLPMDDFVSQVSSASNSLVALRYFLNTVIFIATIVGFFAIFLAMYTAITERTREIGILKALGASKAFILSVFVKEALLLCGMGLLAGVVLVFGGQWLLGRLLPSLQVELGSDWIVKAGLIALVSSCLGCLYPALRAARQDPIDALAYE
ncbi:MAG: ABC transporter permease [Acidobacteria bacterium]|nr:ABC transporter permease [Acidobacteriota bacterium]